MALEYKTRSATGRQYDKAYAKLAFIKIDRTNKIVDEWFNNYPTKALRDLDVFAFFGQTQFTITATPQPATLSGGDPDAFDQAQKDYLLTMGVKIENGRFIHDGIGQLNREWLTQAGITVDTEPKPSYDQFAMANATTLGLVTQQIDQYLAYQASKIYDDETREVCPDAVQVWDVLYIDPVERTIKMVVNNFIDSAIYALSQTDPTIRPCSKYDYLIRPEAQPAGKDARGEDTKPAPSYDDFIGSTASEATVSVDALCFGFAKTQKPYLEAIDILDAPEPTPTPTPTP